MRIWGVAGVHWGTPEIVMANDGKSYGDVIASRHVLRFVDATDRAEVERICAAAGLPANLTRMDAALCFWTPEDEVYWTQTPEDAFGQKSL